MPSYSLDIILLGKYITDIPLFEIWADGVQVGGSYNALSSFSVINTTINYGGALPSSLEFRFNDAKPELSRTIEVVSVIINNRYVTQGNYLSNNILTQGGNSTVTMGGNEFLFDSSAPPAASEFTTGATRTFTTGIDNFRGHTLTSDEVFNMLGGNDYAVTGSGNDKISGDAGDDVIYSMGGNDLVYGDLGDDRIYGGDGDDKLYGGDGADRIHGEEGNDEIHGGAGNDMLNGHNGNDTITGGTGNDNITGGAGNDILYGDEGADQITGGAGDDTIDGGADDDILYGGADDDYINGGTGNDVIVGDAGNDVLHGNAGNDKIYGRADNDTIYGGLGNDLIYGDDGNDNLNGGDDNDNLYGGNGNDIINGDDGNDSLTGGVGDDTLNGGDGDDILSGDQGTYVYSSGLLVLEAENFTTNNPKSGHEWEIITSGAASAGRAVYVDNRGVGNAWMTQADAENNSPELNYTVNFGTTGTYYVWVRGTAPNGGDDSVHIGFDGVRQTDNGGLTDFVGGYKWGSISTIGSTRVTLNVTTTGNHTLNLWAREDGVTVDKILITNNIGYTPTGLGPLESTQNSLVGGADTINGGNGNDIIQGDIGNDILSGGAGVDTIYGGADNDIINGDDGNDLITGGTGVDIINGGNNNDTILLANGDFGVGESINGGANTDNITLIDATTVDFTTGTITAVENLIGSSGNDDVTYTIQQALGFTTINLGSGTDSSRVQVSGTLNVIGLSTPVVTNAENGFLVGSAGNDTLTIFAAQLNALIYGGGIINFNAGTSDTLVIYDTSTSLNTLGLTDSSILGLEIISAFVSGSPVTITMTGQTEDLIIEGGTVNDILSGGSGNDILYGLNGADIMNGNNGNDTFLIFDTESRGDQYFGGAGTDTLSMLGAVYFNSANIFNSVEVLSTGFNTIFIDNGQTVNLSGFTTVIGSTNIRSVGTGTTSETITGTINSDTITTYAGNDFITGGLGADIIDAGNDNDTIYLANGDFAAGESITGGTGTDNITLTNATTVNFSTGTIATVENLIGSSGNDDVTYTIQQALAFTTIDLGIGTDNSRVNFSGTINVTGLNTPTVTNAENGYMTGSAGADNITMSGLQLNALIYGAGIMDFGGGADTLYLTSSSGTLNALNNASLTGLETISGTLTITAVTIDLHNQAEGFTIIGGGFGDILKGGTGNDTITGGIGNDFLEGNAGVDIMDGGADNDTFRLSNGDFAAGESITGGTGTDNILFFNATTVDFSTGTLNTVEVLNGSIGNDDVTYTIQQALAFTTIDLGIGTDNSRVNISGTINVTGLGTPTVTNAENGFITGSAGVDLLTITGAQLNSLVYGSGGIDLGAGYDRIFITSTSANLNTLGATDGALIGVDEIDAGGAGAGVTISITGQTETFAINGSAFNDIITGGLGSDSIYGGNGLDIINGGDGNDTFLIGNSEFAAGESLTGGNGTDNITFLNATTVNFTTGTLNTIEVLNGSTGNDVVTMSGAQLDAFTTLNFNTGTDTLNITSTSTGLNALSDGAITGLENISASAAGAAVTINLSNQTEGFIVTGSASGDTITGSSGNDSIKSGNGNDILSGGEGDDILDGGAGTDTASYSSASSGVTASLSSQNHALDFMGGSQNVSLTGLGLSTTTGSQVTVEFWMQWDGTNSVMPFGFTSYDLWFNGGHFGFNTAGGDIYGISSAGLSGTPVHVAAIFTDGNVANNKIFINGVEQTLTQRLGTYNNSNAQIISTAKISGWNNNTIYKFDGRIDDLRIWNEARTVEEINQYKDYSITSPQTNLNASYTFENVVAGAGGVADESGNGRNGTLVSMTPANQVIWGGSGVSNGYSTGGGGNDIIANVENLIGSNFNDTLLGDTNANTLDGGTGNDIIYGDAGNDILIGGNETASSGTNLILNGSFEDTSNGTGSGITPPSWVRTGPGGGVYAYGGSRGSDGTYSFPIGGWTAALGGEISQTVTTIVGQKYSLFFDAGVNFGSGSTMLLTVSNGVATTLTDTIADTITGNGMSGYFYSFTATTTATKISFQQTATVSGDADFDLDHVRLYESNGDTLYGGAGADTLTGGTGADVFGFMNATAFGAIDTITDFNLSQGDVLDISDLLSGYIPGTSNITNFVQIVDSGANSNVFVDTTGSGTFGAGTQIATLTGITGLTDEANLYSTGHIII